MAFAFEPKPMPNIGKPKLLFNSSNLGLSSRSGVTYDVHPDGRFLMIKPLSAAAGEGPRKISMKILTYLGLPTRAPFIASARLNVDKTFF